MLREVNNLRRGARNQERQEKVDFQYHIRRFGGSKMGLIFKREHIELILRGVKTQTRYRHTRLLKAEKIYSIKRDWTHSTPHRILINRVRRQRLGDITPEEVRAEGGYTVREFMDVWRRINGRWDPDEVIVVYEFKVVDQPDPVSLNRFLEGLF